MFKLHHSQTGRRRISSKHLAQAGLLFLCAIGLLWMSVIEAKLEKRTDVLQNVTITSNDREILLAWDLPFLTGIETLRVEISGRNFSDVRYLPAQQKKFHFTEGVPGTRYGFSVTALYQDGSQGEEIQKQTMFLDESELPNLPVFFISTASGEDPSSEAVQAPEGLWGASLTGNEYLNGNLIFHRPESRELSLKMKICVRGNTSSAYYEKKSYKIVLKEPVDLMDRGGRYADQEWLLLNCGTTLNNSVGEFLSDLCGMEWSPHFMFVNVVLNGDWKGLYLLCESVSAGTARVDVGRDGYIFENDAYWWNSDGIYFKVDEQIDPLGFTFKYPKITDAQDPRIDVLKNYMQTVTTLIRTEDPALWDYIDEDSFAAWIMVRDLMRQEDAGGSNMYYFIYSLEPGNPTEYQLKMGPLWDFDMALRASETRFEQLNGWSAQHTISYTYFSYLFDTEYFTSLYRQKWNSLPQDALEQFDRYLEQIAATEGMDIQKSRELDAERWGTACTDLRQEIDYDKAFIRRQYEWITAELGG